MAAASIYTYGQPGAENPCIVQHYAAADRIPNSINDFVFDSHGMLWITPENDNVRLFDGTNVRMLETPFARGIPQFQFSRVVKDRNENPCFITLHLDYLFRLNAAGALSEDSSFHGAGDHIYNSGDVLFDWDQFITGPAGSPERRSRELLKKRVTDNSSFAALDDSTFAFTEKDSLFVYRKGGLRRVGPDSAKVSSVFLIHGRVFLLARTGFQLIDDNTGESGHVHLTGDILRDSLFRIKPGAESLLLYRSKYPHVRCGSRLYRIGYGNDSLLSTVFVGEIGFIHQPISKVEFEPRSGVTAIATQGDGLFILKPNPFYSRNFDERFLLLKRKMIYYPMTTMQDSFATPWCKFTGNGSYQLFDLTHEGPRAFFADREGNFWDGPKGRIVRYDRMMVKRGEYVIPSPGINVVAFYQDVTGDLYCLTDRSILKYRDGVFADVIPKKEQLPGSILFEQIRYIGDGIFWLAANKGIYSYDQRNNTLKRVAGIPDVFTLNLVRLHGGSILVTSYPASFYYLFYRNRFFQIPVEGDLPLKETSSVLEDRRGRIWFATTSGFFVTTEKEIESWCDGKTSEIYYYRYGRDQGLQDLELNGGLNASNGISGDGYMAFNSMGGLIIFHQDSVREEFPVGEILLTKRGKIGEEYLLTDSMVLPHDNDGMVVQVREPYFGSRDNLRIEYRLGLGGGGWKAVDQQGRIYLEHLINGTYDLWVRVRTGLLPGDYRVRRVVVAVPYLFYETPAFRVVAMVLLLIVLGLVIVVLVRLRREVRMKNVRLHDQNLELQSTMGELQENMALKEKLISLILHDLKTPLYFQSLLFNQIVEEDYFRDDEGRRLFQELRTSSSGILQFTKEFLTWYSSQREGFQVRNTMFHHKLVVDDLFLVYEDIALRKNLKLLYECRGTETLYTDRNILEIIIRNLLDNAIKYTEKGSVSIRFERGDGVELIEVSDTGIGMASEKIRQLERGSLRAGGHPTFGYRFIYTMAEKIGASIRLASVAGNGTCATIILPQEITEPAIGI